MTTESPFVPTTPPPPLWKELQAVDAAATAALDLVQNFAEQEPPTGCWQDPQHMLEQLDSARRVALQAWQTLEDAKQARQRAETHITTPTTLPEPDFRAQFMDMVTTAFADVLAEMKDQERMDFNVLVDCLQSGMDIVFSQEDKEIFLQQEPADDEQETPHERQRRELGFAHVVANTTPTTTTTTTATA